MTSQFYYWEFPSAVIASFKENQNHRLVDSVSLGGPNPNFDISKERFTILRHDRGDPFKTSLEAQDTQKGWIGRPGFLHKV